MQTATAYYDGANIVIDESVKKSLSTGQEITLVFNPVITQGESRSEKRRKFLQSEEGVVPSGRSAEEIDAYIREMRDHERV